MSTTYLSNVCLGQGGDAGSGGNLPVVATGDAEKRLREEEAGEVRHDVAHVDKRSKKMVSSVQLHLQAAGLGPTRPVSVASSRDESKDSLPSPEPKIKHPEQGDSSLYSGSVAEICHPAPITNSVLRELESQGSDNKSWLPAARYTEITNHECSEKVEESKLSQFLGQRDTFTWKYNENAVAKSHSGKESSSENISKIRKEQTDRSFKIQSLPVLRDEEQVQSKETEQFDVETDRTVLRDSCIPEAELEMKGGVDVIGGSGYIASRFVSSDENSDAHVVSRTTADDVDSVEIKDTATHTCPSVTEQSTQVSHQESEPFLSSRSILYSEEVIVAASVSPTSMTVRGGSPEQQGGVKQASSEASILDLQDVEYADADAEDGDDEAEHEEERIKAPAEFSQQVCGSNLQSVMLLDKYIGWLYAFTDEKT
jgi:hypothetical protein